MTSAPDVAGRVAAITGTGVRDCRAVGGGDIAAAHRVTLADGSEVVAKTLADAPPDFFAAEAAGLGLLAGTGTVAVPGVVAVEQGLILLEWIEQGPATPDAAERFGRDLAALHDTPAGLYGTAWPAYIGSLPLPSPDDRPAAPADWPAFHADHRLLPFLRLAADNGGIGADDAAAVERLCENIGQVSGPPQPPAVIHGDLWSGNVHWAASGRTHLLDPAAQGGHPETDLGMLELFGCPLLSRVLAAYEELRPLPGRSGRLALHQLHHLLVHAALFGPPYGLRCGVAARTALEGGPR